MLKGKAKTDYQREYMREYRRNKQPVRPPELDPYKPIDDGRPEVITIDADGNPVYDVG